MVFALGSTVGNDVKWKSAVERALGTWESVVEWADYISFLSRVEKAIKNTHRCDGSQLPAAAETSEMLMRCLEPSLPAGVHQMCIGVYDTVFTVIGPEKLTETINIWLPGLLPVVSWAAFNVKPQVVQLLSKHVVPAVSKNPEELGELYRPILLSLLQSVEDESSDCYAEISALLTALKSAGSSDGSLFWHCYYLCILTSPECRLGALTFIQKNQPSTHEAGLFIRAVCSGLEDDNVLVQRGFLDLLNKLLPLDSKLLENNVEEFENAMLAACRTIARKDMSLNRRLRLWLLGPEPEIGDSTNLSRLEYLRTYAADTLVRVLLKELKRDASGVYLIARGLMDRWEVGVTIAPPLLTPVLKNAREADSADPGLAAFFDNIESNIVWNGLIQLLDSDPETVLFTIQHFNISDEEMLKVYIPLTVLFILAKTDSTETESEIVQVLLGKMPRQELPSAPEEPLSAQDINAAILKYFKDTLEANTTSDEVPPPIRGPGDISWYLIKLAGDMVLRGNSASILNRVLRLIPATPGLHVIIPQSSQLVERLSPKSSDGVELFIHVMSTMSPQQIRQYVTQFVLNLAKSLTSDGYRRVERVRELWQINEAVGNLVVPSALSSVLADKQTPTADRAKIFSGIWVHSADQNDVEAMLTKPLLLFLDLELEDKSSFQAYLQSSIVRTGSSARLVKLMSDKLDFECGRDDNVFSYVLERFVSVLNNQDVRATYATKYAPLVCTLLLDWFDKSLVPEKAYAHALELTEVTILDPRIRDGKMWLRRFVNALTHSYVNEYTADGHQDPEAPEQSTAADSTNDSKPPVPTSLVKFVTAAIPNIEEKSEIRIFAEVCARRLRSEVDFEGFNQLLNSLLSSDPEVEVALLRTIVTKLNELGAPLMDSEPKDIGDNSGVLHLFSAIESIIATALQFTSTQGSNGGGITGSLAGFQVETPEDRMKAASSQTAALNCVQVAITECCKYWLFLQRTKNFSGASGEYTTALHTTGRLKTRLRKLMSLCYSFLPTETLKGTAAAIADAKLAVRMIHMFEGARIGPTLELLLDLATESSVMFRYVAVYIDSLEKDVLGDVWPIVQQFLNKVASASSSFYSSTASSVFGGAMKRSNSSTSDGVNKLSEDHSVLTFLTQSVIPRFDQLKLKNRKKAFKEFTEVYAKLLTLETSPSVASGAIEQMPVVVTDLDRQASLLGRVLGSLLKSPQDISNNAALLTTVANTFKIAGSGPAKVWTRQVGDFVFETRTEKDLIPMTLDQSVAMRPVIKSWVECDKERVKDFISRLPTYGSSTGVLFGWSGTQELANSNLRRLAYITVCTPPNILAVNWSKLTSQLAAMWSENSASVCLLFRALLLGDPSSTMTAFIAFRLQSVFQSTLRKTSPVEGEEADLLVEACKLVDLALVIGLEKFQPFEWLFISDNNDTVFNYMGSSKRKAEEDRSSSSQTDDEKRRGTQVHGRAGGVLERLLDCPAVPKAHIAEQLVAPSPAYKSARRPLLPPRATLEHVPVFLSQISLSSHEEVYARTVPDRQYCEEWLLADLFN